MTWFCADCGEPNVDKWALCHNCDANKPPFLYRLWMKILRTFGLGDQ